MGLETFYTVTLANGERVSINLTTVQHVQDADDRAVFVFNTGHVLRTREPFEEVVAHLGHEPNRRTGQFPLVQP